MAQIENGHPQERPGARGDGPQSTDASSTPPASWHPSSRDLGRLDGDGLLRGSSTDWIRAQETATGELLTNGTLMQRAAAGVARAVAEKARRRRAEHVVVLVGPGNNGGDALFAARDLLRDHSIGSTVILGAATAHEAGLAAVREAGLTVLQHPQDRHDDGVGEHRDGPETLTALAQADLVIDGLLGIGARPSDDAPWDSLVRGIPDAACLVAVDCPSPGVRADVTVTFGALKTSTLLAPTTAGRVEVVDIGLGPQDAAGTESRRLSVLQYAEAWPVPGPKDHKYTRGVVGMATGSDAYPGAAVLGTVAAATAGAGMVRYVGPERPSDAVLAAVPEVVHGPGRVQAWVVGSGIDGPSERDQKSERYRTAMAVFEDDVPVVVDAGALTWIDEITRPEGSVTVITPHAGELASVLTALGVTADGARSADDHDESQAVTREMVEADPVRWARIAADESGFIVLLKGGATVVATPIERRRHGRQALDGTVLIENRSPNWLATAGTGDVLAGVVGVALAAGIEPATACAVATYVHGRAARLANPGGPIRALDVATHVGRAIAELVERKAAFDDDLRVGHLDRRHGRGRSPSDVTGCREGAQRGVRGQ